MNVKPILIKGEFTDMERMLNVAYHEGKKIFNCKHKLKAVEVVKTSYGWVVLLAEPHKVVASASGRLGAETGDK